MKKLISLFISSVFAISLTSCGNQSGNFMEQQKIGQNTVLAQSNLSTMSVETFYEFIKVLHRKTFEAFDNNQDGYITRDEFQGEDNYFTLMDQDKNGKVTFKEANTSQYVVFEDIEFWQDVYKNLFKWADTSEDSIVSREEFYYFFLSDPANPSAAKIKYFKTLFSKNDINKDNILNYSEFEDAQAQLWKRDIVVKILAGGTVFIDFRGYQ
jgi:Ca2+-binding EF-hand superfamily protein